LGKISNITKADGSSLEYKYDPSGNRVYKAYTHDGVTDKTWYVRDAQGNTLAVYGNVGGGSDKYWKEMHLYGSSRLGVWEPGMVLGGGIDTMWNKVGLKRYELTNHLGNVLATISDKVVRESGYYKAEVLSAGDYYPFGMGMMDRKYSLRGYRYGFNGKENDNEVKGEGNEQDYGMRVYDPRVGRFLSVDPITSKYPELTPYQFASNRVIDGFDQDGLEYNEYIHPQQVIRRNMASMGKKEAAEYYDRGNRIGAMTVGGFMLAGVGAAAATGAGTYAWVSGLTWLSVPTNQLTISTGAGFVFTLLNPDPGTNVDFPGAGDEVANGINWALKNRSGKVVNFLMESGAKFVNGESKWAQRLLDEGNNVIVLKESTKEGQRTADFLVNGRFTDLKEVSSVSKLNPDDLSNTLSRVIENAKGQANAVILDVTQQAGATIDVARRGVNRYFGQGTSITEVRIIGKGFDEKLTRSDWLKFKNSKK
jgi:RHS repeat-associated protein